MCELCDHRRQRQLEINLLETRLFAEKVVNRWYHETMTETNTGAIMQAFDRRLQEALEND